MGRLIDQAVFEEMERRARDEARRREIRAREREYDLYRMEQQREFAKLVEAQFWTVAAPAYLTTADITPPSLPDAAPPVPVRPAFNREDGPLELDFHPGGK